VGQAFAAGTLELNDGDGDAVTFTTAADVGAGGYSLTFPAALGTNGQLLTIDGSGNIVFADAVVDSDTTYTGSGGVTLTGTDFTADLGTDIVTGEIVDGTILLADLDAASYETTTVDSTTDGDDLVTEAAVVAYVAANGDDLGDHEATQALDLNTFKLVGNDGTLGLVVDASGNVAVDGTITSSSDRNLKKNILPLTGALDKLLAITGVNYEWKDGRSAGTQIGVIAQDVQAVYPELVGSNDAGLTVNYAGLVAPLIEAVRAQQAQIDELKAEIDALKE